MTALAWAAWPTLVVDPAFSFLVCALAARLGIVLAAAPWRGIDEGFWVERARRAYPVRRVMGAAILLPFACSGLVFLYASSSPSDRLPPLAAAPALIGSLGWGPFVAFVLLLVLFSRFQMGWVRSLEQKADSVAHAHQPAEGAYARALARVFEANLLPVSTSGAGRTHPHLYDRLVAAGATPDYPRPQPPSRIQAFLATLVCIATVIFGWTAFEAVQTLLR